MVAKLASMGWCDEEKKENRGQTGIVYKRTKSIARFGFIPAITLREVVNSNHFCLRFYINVTVTTNL